MKIFHLDLQDKIHAPLLFHVFANQIIRWERTDLGDRYTHFFVKFSLETGFSRFTTFQSATWQLPKTIILENNKKFRPSFIEDQSLDTDAVKTIE